MNCIVCNKEITTINRKKFPDSFCSFSCYENWQKINKEPNCSCCVCGKKLYIKPYRLKRIKTSITCSLECSSKLKSVLMKGEGNHQYGLTGKNNSSFKGDCILTNYGYVLEYCPGHPYPHDNSSKTQRVLQYRLVIERNHEKFDDSFFEEINGFIVLKQCYDVHHKNEIKTDNRLENLEILLRSEHTALHNKNKKILRDNLGKIIGVLKREELLETPEVDNQQPSITLTSNEGSETNG